MASFTVRIEMQLASTEDYSRLHDSMAVHGYSREIRDASGNIYHLPSAEYIAEKNLTARGVMEEVSAIASAIKSNPIVLVTQASDRSWRLIRR